MRAMWFIGALFLYFFPVDLKKIQLSGYAQGTSYHITYFAPNDIIDPESIDSILNRLDSSLSIYKPNSLINQFNNSPQGIFPDAHFLSVVKRAIEVSQSTNGLFDITVAPLVNAWGFGINKINEYPDSLSIADKKGCVGYSSVIISENGYVAKKKSCILIDVNGIAQGYSVDVIADYLESKGVQDYLVELGGEIRVKGINKLTGKKMKVGIISPSYNEFIEDSLENNIEIKEGAVTTSGNYRKYKESNRKRITHIINPISGYPVENELISVTVYAKDAMTADAYDNALMLMGLTNALNFISKQKEIEAYFIYKKSNGEIADTASAGFNKLLKK